MSQESHCPNLLPKTRHSKFQLTELEKMFKFPPELVRAEEARRRSNRVEKSPTRRLEAYIRSNIMLTGL